MMDQCKPFIAKALVSHMWPMTLLFGYGRSDHFVDSLAFLSTEPYNIGGIQRVQKLVSRIGCPHLLNGWASGNTTFFP